MVKKQEFVTRSHLFQLSPVHIPIVYILSPSNLTKYPKRFAPKYRPHSPTPSKDSKPNSFESRTERLEGDCIHFLAPFPRADDCSHPSPVSTSSFVEEPTLPRLTSVILRELLLSPGTTILCGKNVCRKEVSPPRG